MSGLRLAVLSFACGVVVVFASPGGVARAQVLKSLVPLSGKLQAQGRSVDGSANAVGLSGSPSFNEVPTIWRPSGSTYTATQLPLPAGLVTGGANFINPSGYIAGYGLPSNQETSSAVLWTPGAGGTYTAASLALPPGAASAGAYAINGSNEVAGFTATATGERGVVWSPAGTPTVLPSLPGWTDTGATAVNNLGNVAGYAFGDPNEIVKAAVWEKGAGGTYTPKNVISVYSAVVTAMNDSGVGAAVYNGDQPGVMVNFEDEYYAFELNVPFGTSDGAANALNNADALVGYLKDPTTAQTGGEAALWLPTDDEWQLINLDAWLNTNVPSLGTNWTLVEAFGISDNWLVTGVGMFGTFNPVERGFVLDVSSLVPEPSTAGAAATGVLALGSLRRRRRAPVSR